MSNTLRRRPVELASSVSSDGPFSEHPSGPPQLIPSELPRAACPINPRPRNQRAYSAACAAAKGEKVTEYDAFEVEEGMRAWCCESFLTVVAARHMSVSQINDSSLKFLSESSRSHPFVLLQLSGAGQATGWLIGDLDTPVYCLA